jgi:peptidyl-prolyl cis-trans isomerase A (cyclophilin A)
VTPPVAVRTVTGITASTLSYGTMATFTVSGTNLDMDLSVSVNQCAGLTLAAGGTTTTKSLSCKVNGAGALVFSATDGAGTILLSKTFEVPQPQVTLLTSAGKIVLELNPTAAPISVNNYLAYVNAGYYSSTLFHRVVPGFVAQGGGFTTGPVAKPTLFAPIALESSNGLSNLRGTVGMARTATPNSATSQFYVNLVDNKGLDYVSASEPGYAVFGKVVEGMAGVDAMSTVATRTVGSLDFVPKTDIVIQSAQQTR